MSDKKNWQSFMDTVKNSISVDRFTMDNQGLLAFWTTGYLNESIYYIKEMATYVIANVQKENLFIYQIISTHRIDLDKIISSFGSEIKKVTLGFTPYDSKGYIVEEFQEEDCTLFIYGKDLEIIEKKKLMFPALSHA